MSPSSCVDSVCGDVGGKKRTGTPVVCFARDIRSKDCEARTDVSRVSDDSASVRDAEAYVNTDCHEESETSRALLVESKQPGASVNKPFSFLQWNVNGLLAKLKDNEFISFVSHFDFVCFVETFMETFQSNVFVDYIVFVKSAVKLSKQGRHSGGIVCLIRNEYAPYVRKLDVEYLNIMVFLIDKELFGVMKDILYVCAYVPPEGSPFYPYFDVDNGIGLLEECLTDCMLTLNDVYVIMAGDLNSRTASNSQINSMNDNIFESLQESQPVNLNRKSQDNVVNNYGKFLLNLCTTFDLCILNGVCKGDLQGCYTYISETGSSVNDYFILSNDLYALIHSTCELCVTGRIESDHMPLTFRVIFPKENVCSDEVSQHEQIIEKFVWDNLNAPTFTSLMCTDETCAILDEAISLIDLDIDKALDIFNNCIKEKAECMKKQITIKNGRKLDEWFDWECKVGRRNVRRLLKKYSRSLLADDRSAFCLARREYKNLLKKKKKDFYDVLLDKLISSVKNQKDFWEFVHKISPKRKSVYNNISLDSWFQHFRALLEKEVDFDFDDENAVQDNESSLNRPISKEEVLLAFKKLKNKKAAGPDGIIGEMLKNSGTYVIDFFVKFFNALFEKGIFPTKWTESIVFPLFKKGDVNNPNNYRGISLGDASCKLYSTIINLRLQEWVEVNNITGEHQAGFKKNYSTIDHMFTLLAFVQKQFSLNRKLYVAFIDFEKAFDSINRKLLWPILLKNGINGKLYRCIKSMYNSVKVRVRCGSKMTDYINCTFGVKQGDVCSPVLFSLFINELALEVIQNGRHGASFINDYFELFILLLADDVVLLSETVIGLQTQLNSLQRASSSLQLKVNMSKSNIVVFRKGGYLGARERWTYDSVVLPVVNVYKYLGVLFSTKLSFTASCHDLTSKAKNAALCIMQKLRMLNNNSFELFLKLFDSQVQPIALYGAELWGLETAAVHCEKVHLFALKRFLGVEMRTPNDLVYGETNRYPLFVNSAVRCIRYWLKLTRMEASKLPSKAYRMLHILDERGKRNWASNVRCKLYQYGFGFVWLNQGVEEMNQFLHVFRERLVVCRWQEWHSHVETSDRFNVYRTFCTIHDTKTYLKMNIDRHLKFIMTRFRLGISGIFVHYYRYKRHTDNDLICPLCRVAQETELHFVLCCPVLSALRVQFIPSKFYKFPSLFRLSLLLASTNENIVRNLSVYLYKAFNLRSILSS